MKNKIVSIDTAAELIKDEMTIMVGGFMAVGTPEVLMDAVVKKGVKNLTLISTDTAMPGVGVGKLIRAKQVKKLIASHIGLNSETGLALNSNEIEVELVPQGTLVERIRSGGAGLGGVLTPTGLGTEVEKGKEIISILGKDYLLELPLKADVALIRGTIVDKAGNVFYKGTTKNFNQTMAMAAKIVIVAAEKIVEVGEIEQECIMTQGIFVDYIVEGEI